MSRKKITATSLSFVLFCAATLCAQSPTELEERVRSLVLAHHVHGIEYLQANALGPDAIPILLEILGDESLEEYWVNTVVTLGFIEDSSALEPLIEFLYSRQGEVGIRTVRALSAVPFAVGCIASNGSPEAFAFLSDGTEGRLQPGWTFGSVDPASLLAGKSVIALAVSGRPEGKAALDRLAQQGPASLTAPGLAGSLATARSLISRLENEPRAAIFNPQFGER